MSVILAFTAAFETAFR